MNTNNGVKSSDEGRFFLGLCTPAQVKVLFSIVSTFVWMGFSLYWIAFVWSSFNFIQNVTLLALAFLVFSASNAILWVME